MKVLTTLAENDYFLGVSALINSVVNHGTYVDKVVVGYRGGLPAWLPELSPSKNGRSCRLPSGLEIEFVEVTGNLHMVHEKPTWFRYLIEHLQPDAEEFFFFDSDIIVTNRMSFFGEWVREGVALCGDVNYDMESFHPIRLQWKRIAGASGLAVNNDLTKYFNSGFLGWNRATAQFVLDWERCFKILAKEAGDMKKFRVHDRTRTVLSANQDSLNLAAMTTDVPISAIGPEAMGFRYGFRLMQHPIGLKPWTRSYLFETLRGNPPRDADGVFWNSVCGSELAPFSPTFVKWKRLQHKLAKGASLFYHKSLVALLAVLLPLDRHCFDIWAPFTAS